jgi:glycosyltransferase involved in cell wall biosynthesis
MKICLINAVMDLGGASIVAFDVAKGMAHRGHEVIFVSSGKREVILKQDGYTIYLLANNSKSPVFHYLNPILLLKLVKILIRHKPDIIHVHNINLQTFSLAILLLSRFYPMVWTLHDIWPLCMTGWPPIPDCSGMLHGCERCPTWPKWMVRINRMLKEITFRYAKLYIVSPSKWLASLTLSSRLSRHPLHLIYNGIDPGSYSYDRRDVVRSRLGISESKKVILFCGGKRLAGQSPAWRKGWKYLSEAIGILGPMYNNLHLLYIGDRLELPPAYAVPVSFVEGVQREEMRGFFNAADIFVLPSLADHPALTVLEAMAFRTPIIATRAGGIPEAVTNNETGLLCPSRNTTALADQIEYLIGNPTLGEAMAEAAYNRFNKLFSSDRMTDQYEEIFRLAVSCRSESTCCRKTLEGSQEENINHQEVSQESFERGEKPIITIIVATLNAAATLERLIKSIISQTYPYKELIIIDGGSTDETRAIISNNQKYISHWESKADRGIYHAWNKALHHAQGEWICFLGADDFLWNSDVLEKMIPHLNNASKNDFRYVYGKSNILDAIGNILYVEGKHWHVIKERFARGPFLPLAHSGSFHHIGLFKKYGKFDDSFKITGDYDFLLRSLKKRGGYFVDDFIVAGLPIGGISRNLDHKLKFALEALKTLRRHSNHLPWPILVILIQLYIFECIVKVYGKKNAVSIADHYRTLFGKQKIWSGLAKKAD